MPANWTALSASALGAAHERDGRRNQDAVRLYRPVPAAEPLVIGVADGHGSARSFRSDRGAAFATDTALVTLREFVRRHGAAPLSRQRRLLAGSWVRSFLEGWRRAVRSDIAREPFTLLDFAAFPEAPPVLKPGRELPFEAYLAYGATLLATVVTRRHIYYAQLGDGDILTVQGDGRVSRPWRREHAFYASQTVSLCSPDAAYHFRCKIEPLRGGTAPALVLLATDGYSNCFVDDEGFFRVGADFLDYLREAGTDFVGEKLESWLLDSSRDGSGDDITVGLAVRLSALRGAPANPAATFS